MSTDPRVAECMDRADRFAEAAAHLSSYSTMAKALSDNRGGELPLARTLLEAHVESMAAEISRLTTSLAERENAIDRLETEVARLTAELEESKGESLSGKWYCESHPEHEMGHDGCNGAGILGCARIERFTHLLRMSRQETRETERMRDDLGANLRTTLAELEEARKDAGRSEPIPRKFLSRDGTPRICEPEHSHTATPLVRPTDEVVREWMERHDIGTGHMSEMREAFEDAQSWHLSASAQEKPHGSL